MQSADRAFIAETTAKMLLEVKAVLFWEDKPFIFTSGWASPVYIDCRKLIFYPRIRAQLVEFAEATLARDAGFEQFDVVAGGAEALRAAWTYREPSEPFAALRDHVSFYPALVACRLDDEPVEPQPGGFYGGWVTAEICGPIKGAPGSAGW